MAPSSDVRCAATRAVVRGAESEVVGPWMLVRLLGEGTWTRVYQARPRDGPANRPADYAVKLIKRPSGDERLAEWLLRREAQVGQSVSHPHLIPVLSASLDRPPLFVVTPLLIGATMQQTLDAGLSTPSPHALWIGRQVAEALQELHARGWLHGDVKPGNVLVAPEGHATLIDLGFARRLHSPETAANAPAVGAPSYRAPEAFSGALPIGGQSDTYSLGVTLYQLLTGRLPFECGAPEELAVAHMQRRPPEPRAVAPKLSLGVSRLLKRMLAKEPLRRPDPAELVAALAKLEIEAFAERSSIADQSLANEADSAA